MKWALPRPAQIFCLGTISAWLYLRFGYHDGIIGDALDYHRLGLWLAQFNLFSLDGIHLSAARPPLYPFFISIIYRLLGTRPGAVYLLQGFLAGGTATLTYALARLDYSERKSTWAGALCAFHPVLMAYASYFLSETLFIFLLCAGIFLYRFAQKTGRVAFSAGSGAALGLACLTRAILVYFPLFWVLYEWIRTRKMSRESLLWACVFYACLAPWALRNYSAFGVAIPVSVGGGYALWAGAHPGQYPKTSDYSAFIAPYAWDSPVGDKAGTARALRLYRDNLPGVLIDIPGRSLHFWLTSHSAIFGYSESIGQYWRNRSIDAIAVKCAGFVIQVAILIFTTRGVILGFRRPEIYFPLALILYTWILIVLTDYWPNRYHVPLIPLMIYLGAHGF